MELSKAERARNAAEWEKKQNTGLYADPIDYNDPVMPESEKEKIERRKKAISLFLKGL